VKLKLEVELEHFDGPTLDTSEILEGLRSEFESSDIWIESDKHEDEGAYTIKTVKSLD
jgi:hypothetical protein